MAHIFYLKEQQMLDNFRTLIYRLFSPINISKNISFFVLISLSIITLTVILVLSHFVLLGRKLDLYILIDIFTTATCISLIYTQFNRHLYDSESLIRFRNSLHVVLGFMNIVILFVGISKVHAAIILYYIISCLRFIFYYLLYNIMRKRVYIKDAKLLKAKMDPAFKEFLEENEKIVEKHKKEKAHETKK